MVRTSFKTASAALCFGGEGPEIVEDMIDCLTVTPTSNNTELEIGDTLLCTPVTPIATPTPLKNSLLLVEP